jgi:hypothetical protein
MMKDFWVAFRLIAPIFLGAGLAGIVFFYVNELIGRDLLGWLQVLAYMIWNGLWLSVAFSLLAAVSKKTTSNEKEATADEYDYEP